MSVDGKDGEVNGWLEAKEEKTPSNGRSQKGLVGGWWWYRQQRFEY